MANRIKELEEMNKQYEKINHDELSSLIEIVQQASIARDDAWENKNNNKSLLQDRNKRLKNILNSAILERNYLISKIKVMSLFLQIYYFSNFIN